MDSEYSPLSLLLLLLLNLQHNSDADDMSGTTAWPALLLLLLFLPAAHSTGGISSSEPD